MQKIKRYIAGAMAVLLAVPVNLLLSVSVASAAVTAATINGVSSSDLEAGATNVSYTVSLTINGANATAQTGIIDVTFPSQYTGKITNGSYDIFDAICGNTDCNDSDMTTSDPTGSSAGEIRVDRGEGSIDYVPVTNVIGSSVARKIRVMLPPSEFLASTTVSFVLQHGINNPTSSGSLCNFIVTTNVDGSVTPGCVNLTSTFDPNAGVGYHYVIQDPSDGTVDASIPVTVKLYDGYNNLVTSGPYKDDDITLLADGDAEGGLVNITDGVGTVNVSDHTAENVELSLSDTGETGFTHSSTQNVDFGYGAPSHFEFDNSSNGTVDNPITVTVRLTDQYGNQVYNDSSTRVALVPDNGSSSLGEGATLTMSNGEASVDVTDHTPETVGLHLNDIDETGYVPDPITTNITFNTGSANQFVILEPNSPATVGDTVPVTIQLEDQYGNLLTNDNSSSVTLQVDGDGQINNNGVATMSGGTATMQLTDTTAETAHLTLTGSELVESSSQQVTFNPGSLDHFDESLSQETIQAGQVDHLTITAKDQYGNTVTNYSGDHNFLVSGLQDAPNGHRPTMTDKNGEPIDLTGGDPSFVVLTFTNGVNTAGGDLTMYKSFNELFDNGHAYEGEVTGSFPFFAENAAADHYTLSSDDNNTVDESATVDVMLYDQYGNPVFTGDYSNGLVTLSANHSGNFGGETQETVEMTQGIGETSLSDKVAETVDVTMTGFPDGAPTSNNGPLEVAFAHGIPAGFGIATHDNNTATSITVNAGTSTQLAIAYVDQYGNLIDDYTGSRSLDFSGIADSPNGVPATVTDLEGIDQPFTNPVFLDFTNGVTHNFGTLKPYKTGSHTLVVEDHNNHSLTSDQNYDNLDRSGNMTVNVGPATVQSLSFDPLDGNPVELQQFNMTLKALDLYGNTVDGSNDGSTYSGTVGFTTSAPGGHYTLPDPHTFTGEDGGVYTFPATFNNASDSPITVTATDQSQELSGQTQFTLDSLNVFDPTGTPAPGVYTSTQQVALSADGATTIHYNLGSAPTTPTCDTGTVYTQETSDPVNVTKTNNIIKAISCYPNSETSNVSTMEYSIITVAPPTSSPVTGSTFSGSRYITLNHNSDATSIHYTTNNSTPDCTNSETLYDGPFLISATTTVKAIACYAGENHSSVATFTFTLSAPTGGGGPAPTGGGGPGPSGGSTGPSGGSTNNNTSNTGSTQATTSGGNTTNNGGGQAVGDCSSAVTNVGQDEPFTDEIGHWSHDCVLMLYRAGVVTGRAPHLYVPEGNLTRAEAVKIGLLAFGYKLDVTTKSGFTDLDPKAWYVPYLRKAKSEGFISGTKFHPNDPITRADALVMYLKMANKTDLSAPAAPFSDVSQDALYASAINYAYAKGIVKGRTPTTFVPLGTITRAEIAKVVALIKALQ